MQVSTLAFEVATLTRDLLPALFPEPEWWRIVGVVEDIHQVNVDSPPLIEVYEALDDISADAFGENFDFVLYPNLSASWEVSEEPIARAWDGLRAAWGEGAARLPAGATLRLTLRVENAFDEEYNAGGFGVYTSLGVANFVRGAPRVVGASVRVPFGGERGRDRPGDRCSYGASSHGK